jgi:hypothetical protein
VGRLRRVALAIAASVAAWFVLVMVLLVLYFAFGFDGAELTATIAAPGSFVNGALNTLYLLIPEFFLARAIYRRLVAPR